MIFLELMQWYFGTKKVHVRKYISHVPIEAVLGQDTSEPQPNTDETQTQEIQEKINCRLDVTEKCLQRGKNHHSINQLIK